MPPSSIFSLCLFLLLSLFSPSFQNDSPSTPPLDPEGYLLFCLCMGRLGNQMEHFLGALDFAKAINRTLVLPPFVSGDGSRKVSWKEWFRVKPLRHFHRVVLAETFMKSLAPRIWPVGQRVGFCYRRAADDVDEDDYRCDIKEGSPFGPFWDSLGVDFDSYQGYSMSYRDWNRWRQRFPSDRFPVLALKGAPAPYPMDVANWALQRHVRFSEDVERRAEKFIKGFLPAKKFVGIHLRNGRDWENACESFQRIPQITTGRNYMASPQCYGEHHEKVTAPFAFDVCLNSAPQVVGAVERAVDAIGAGAVYIATDHRSYEKEMKAAMKSRKVDVVFLDPDSPLYDLSILSRADLFIGNCFSSFSSFVRRIREVDGKPSRYFGFD